MEGVSDIVIFLGRFHPLVVHLPIGFLVLAIVCEIISRRQGFEKFDAVIPFMWFTSALASTVAVVLGYLLSLGGDYDERTLMLHQWSGISLAAMSFGCYLLRNDSLLNKKKFKRFYQVLLVLITMSLLVTGHLGGSLTHGSEYLVEFAPKSVQRLMGSSSVDVEDRAKVNSLDSADVFKDAIAPILNSKCITCHNSNKRKGKLILTSFNEIMKGGENGEIITPGRLASSEMYRRITLPRNHKEFMPSEGKKPLTDEQLAIIEWWIEKRAPESALINSLGPDKDMVEVFEKYFGLGKNREEVLNPPPADTSVINTLFRNGFNIRRLAAESNLMEARFSGKSIDTTKMKYLLGLKDQLVWLQLSNTGISDKEMEIVGQLLNLRKLNLSKNPISDDGINHLLMLHNLEYLNLYETNVTDSILVSLMALQQLEELYLWHTKVSVEYMEKLKPSNPRLKIIYTE